MATKRDKRASAAAAAAALLFGEDDGKSTGQLRGGTGGEGARDVAPRGKDGGSGKGSTAPVDRPAGRNNRAAKTAGIPDKPTDGDVPPSHGIRASRGDVNVGPSHDVAPTFQTAPHLRSKKHPPGSLPVNTPVWYKGERYYIEWSSPDWTQCTFVRISSKRLPIDRPGAHYACDGVLHLASVFCGGQNILDANRQSHCVHPDHLSLAPVMTARAELTGRTISANQQAARERGDKDIGDPIAVMLREAKSLDDVYRIGAKYLGVKEQELRERYGKLNPGQQRMNVGNRMRAAWRKGQK